MGAERDRLEGDELEAWRAWGPFVSERSWGTVREDYSADGEAWGQLTHDQARSFAYRWGEDGLAAVCDRRQGLCMGLALWNGVDPILKERLFGLTGKEGNHGEDVKECYWYVDATPTHSWASWRYHYPQAAFPYADLLAENRRRGFDDPEYELVDTGVFDQGYWAVTADYAKGSPSDLCLRIRATNHGPATAELHVLPTVWLRNVWAWGADKPRTELRGHAHADGHALVVDHLRLGRWVGAADVVRGAADGPRGELLFCENERNSERLYGVANATPFPKDGINDHVVGGAATVNPDRTGTKSAWWFHLRAEPGETVEVRVRLSRIGPEPTPADLGPVIEGLPADAVRSGHAAPGSAGAATATTPSAAAPGSDTDPADGDAGAGVLDDAQLDAVTITDADLPDLAAGFDDVVSARRAEADEFYAGLTDHAVPAITEDRAMILRAAFAGLLWSQQFYRYDVARWLDGDPAGPAPPPGRGDIRNGHWRHLDANDVIVMPDKWEYPWFASWDLAFHCVALAHVDPGLAKEQLLLLFEPWYQHPNGELPAYEWEFGDANPPVHAWAALRVFEIDGRRDHVFLERIFHKLNLNFTWWVNQEDPEGNNAFEGGFLGLDNIGPFNRSEALPVDGVLEQSDGTGWMASYCLDQLEIALVLAARNPAYEDLAIKYFEHFSLIAEAMTQTGLWSEDDGFFYDVVRMGDGAVVPMRIRSMVGLVPAVALTVVRDDDVVGLDSFLDRARWFLRHKPTASGFFGRYVEDEQRAMGLLAVISPDRLGRILRVVLDESEFLSPFGLRSLSRAHLDEPVEVDLGGFHAEVGYEPAESTSGLFGGNSNWRGPVWFPVNFLVIEKLRRFHEFVGDGLTVELPTGSGNQATLGEVADELARRLVALFESDPESGTRPADGPTAVRDGTHRAPPAPWYPQPWFYEYFDGDTGRGLGASHQTGWTALVADLILSLHPRSVV